MRARVACEDGVRGWRARVACEGGPSGMAHSPHRRSCDADAPPAYAPVCVQLAKPEVTSGLGADEEYRRTVGALFAVYWLMRIGIDGERGFCFGVDERWAPHAVPTPADAAESKPASEGGSTLKEPAKRLAFYEAMDWQRIQMQLQEVRAGRPATGRRVRASPAAFARTRHSHTDAAFAPLCCRPPASPGLATLRIALLPFPRLPTAARAPGAA